LSEYGACNCRPTRQWQHAMIAKFGKIFQRRIAPGQPGLSVFPETGLPRPRTERNLGPPLEVLLATDRGDAKRD
jgi:hypothetical protein